MRISLASVHVGKRLRKETYGDLNRFARGLIKRGQLQDILVRDPLPDDDCPPDKKYIIEDGGRRFFAFLMFQKLFDDPEVDMHSSLEQGMIDAKYRGEQTDIEALEAEYHSNEDREGFSWRERTEYINKIHKMRCSRDPEWNVELTAAVLDVSEATVYRYLDFYRYPEIFGDDRVKTADSFNTAWKQFQIIKELKERESIVKHREAREKKKKEERPALVSEGDDKPTEQAIEDLTSSEFAREIFSLADCREWIKQWPDETFDWVHWDPPYGGEQEGGAFGSWMRIDDTWSYAEGLLKEMLPQIHRVLRPGRWLALWFHPSHHQDVTRMLAGHDRDPSTDTCRNCLGKWNSSELGYVCSRSPHPFWVNPYPNIWYKVDRKSDGHEIKRFLINSYETFVFACKEKRKNLSDPILPRSDRQNVFTYTMVPRSSRRHVMHKPPSLLTEILSCISIPGEVGCDPSAGSGSIFEAALSSRRRVVGCELAKEIHDMALPSIETAIRESGVEPYTVISHSDKSLEAVP